MILSVLSWQVPLAIALTAALTTLVFAVLLIAHRRRTRRRIRELANRLATGDLSAKPGVSDGDEWRALSSSMDVLREQAAARLDAVNRRRQTLQALIDQLQEGVIVARSDGRIALMNPAAARLLNLGGMAGRNAPVGRPVKTCIPQEALRNLLLEPSAAELQYDNSADVTAAGNGIPVETRLEIESRNGTIHLLARASTLDLAELHGEGGGSPVGRVVMFTDVTEMQRTIQVRTDFVANASHELRTPLSTIRAAVETLMTMDLQSETSHALAFIEKIDRHSARLQQMVADLLDLSRLESPAERFEPEVLEGKRIVQDLHVRFAEALERKRLSWRVRCEPEDACTILANAHLVRLTLDNLVDNAIKFTDPGGRISVCLTRVDDSAVFDVADDGCGIPDDEQQRVFERFYQVQRSRSGRERGTGLGLSIVRHAVGAMDGSVHIESAPGVGTRVTVVIPQAKE